jgi:hypothetical protein
MLSSIGGDLLKRDRQFGTLIQLSHVGVDREPCQNAKVSAAAKKMPNPRIAIATGS